MTITDPQGNVIAWASSGHVGFKGSRKSTPFAAQLAAENAARKAQDHGVRKVDVFVKGPGSGRETAIRSLQAAGLEVGAISDVTPSRITVSGPQAPARLGEKMARYTGPVTRKSRRLRTDLVGGDQAFEKRPTRPANTVARGSRKANICFSCRRSRRPVSHTA